MKHEGGNNTGVEKNAQSAGTSSTAARSKPTPSLGRQLVHCICAAVIALGSYWIASHYLFQKVIVEGNSMKPTLHSSDTYMLNRIEYLFRKPQWGDIVVIRDPEDGNLSIKRVVAVEGQSVDFSSGKVFVDGLKLPEYYLRPGIRTTSFLPGRDRFLCGDNQYFVLGDNRPESADSRVYGPVPRQNILGLVVP